MAKRRVFSKGYRLHGPPGRYSWAHEQMAKEVVRDATCAHGYLGGCSGPLHADHIVPISLGGATTKANYQALCARHNIAKGGRNRL